MYLEHRKRREKNSEAIIEILVKNFSKLGKDINPQIQEVLQTLSRTNTTTTTTNKQPTHLHT